VIAYADESIREDPAGLLYVLGASVMVGGDLDGARADLRKLLLPGEERLHWRDEREVRRLAVLRLLVDLDVAVFVRWQHPVRRRRQEHARAACLRALAGDLAREGLDELVIEARQERLNRDDLSTLVAARQGGLIPDGFRYRFARPKEEPLLWLADAVAGAVGAHLGGTTSAYLGELRPTVLSIRRTTEP
jgi:hypothetical protein